MRARERLLQALRGCSRGAGVRALRALAPLLYAAAEEETREPEEPSLELCFELIRILGAEMCEETPLSVQDAALRALDLESTAGEVAMRKVLAPLCGELREALELLKHPRSTELSPADIERLQQVERVRFAVTSRLVGVKPTGLRRRVPGDPLALFLELERLWSRAIGQLAATLSTIYDPVRIGPEEALAVASSLVGGPPVDRAGVLELARQLDGFCARGPLSATDLERLLELARVADTERKDPSWPALADRLWMLRARLFRSGKASTPLDRSMTPRSSEAPIRRPDSLEAILLGAAPRR